ncbi:Tannase/feruloyl esterase [Favolaschia claudopus]|uniref:Carboxylic ester hydrolase n=1 Tax=Favolaschia claudopus TaxID=2862362 RepID=A0AAW0EHR3_9AGAR
MRVNLFTAATVVAASTHVSAAYFQQSCNSIASKLSVHNATISGATFVQAGTTLTFPDVDPSCKIPLLRGTEPQVVSADICRVKLTIATSTRSRTAMEVWLPSNWTGRFLATGGVGIGGCVQYNDMNYGASLGFATSGSDNGHTGQNGTLFLNNTDVVDDFAFRGLLTSAQVGKQITREFYGKAQTKSYYSGCSEGGREGWKMAQDFPDEFDGILVGAPAFAWTELMSWDGMFLPLIKNAGPNFPPQSLWPVVDAGILAQCDGLDGAMDGIIEEPSRCHFNPDALICAPGQTSACLTSQQADTVRAVFSPLFADGTFIYPALQFGPGLLGQIYQSFGATQFLLTDNWFRFAVFNDPAFNTTMLTQDEIIFAQMLNPGGINTFSGDISKFRKRGSKILHFHGQVDPLISSLNSNRYYDLVSETMKMRPAALDAFYRFFRISGMGHCAGGPGATWIGNGKENAASLDPDQNVLMAMVRWVEQGIPPDTILGTAYVNQTQGLGVDFQRAHCRYPFHNMFSGKGSVKDPANWNCVL